MFRREELREGCQRRAGGGTSVGLLIMLTGLALATAAGILFGSQGASGPPSKVIVATVMLALGALMAVLGVSGSSRAARMRAELESLARLSEAPSRPPPRVSPPGALPLLGELLVHKYHLITEKDLARALARQQETGERLGRILVEMNLVKWPDLVRVLEDQVSYGDPWRRNGPPGYIQEEIARTD